DRRLLNSCFTRRSWQVVIPAAGQIRRIGVPQANSTSHLGTIRWRLYGEFTQAKVKGTQTDGAADAAQIHQLLRPALHVEILQLYIVQFNPHRQREAGPFKRLPDGRCFSRRRQDDIDVFRRQRLHGYGTVKQRQRLPAKGDVFSPVALLQLAVAMLLEVKIGDVEPFQQVAIKLAHFQSAYAFRQPGDYPADQPAAAPLGSHQRGDGGYRGQHKSKYAEHRAL